MELSKIKKIRIKILKDLINQTKEKLVEAEEDQDYLEALSVIDELERRNFELYKLKNPNKPKREQIRCGCGKEIECYISNNELFII